MKKAYITSLILVVVMTIFVSCGTDKYLKRGEKFLAIGEYFEAAEEFKTAYNKTPSKDKEKRGACAVKLADCYKRINYTQKAIAAYRNAIRYKCDNAELHLDFAQMLLKNGNYKEAVKE